MSENMESDQIGLFILGIVLLFAGYGAYKLYSDIKKYFIRKKKENSGIIRGYDE